MRPKNATLTWGNANPQILAARGRMSVMAFVGGDHPRGQVGNPGQFVNKAKAPVPAARRRSGARRRRPVWPTCATARVASG